MLKEDFKKKLVEKEKARIVTKTGVIYYDASKHEIEYPKGENIQCLLKFKATSLNDIAIPFDNIVSVEGA